MSFGGRKATLLLFAGDLLVFGLSLWVTLLIRYQELPSEHILLLHLRPFAALFLLWVLVLYMAGLYGKPIIRFKTEVWGALLRTQLLNIILAALFFFLAPIGIAPKTNLAIYLIVSLVGIFAWRLQLFPRVSARQNRVAAALVGAGAEVDELRAEVNSTPRYSIEFRVVADAPRLRRDFAGFVAELKAHKVSLIVVDAEDGSLRPLLPQLYELAFGQKERYQFADFYAVYGEVFDRVPLSMLRYEWFIKNISLERSSLYALGKRAIDLLGGALMGLITLVLVPLVYIAQQLEGPGPLFLRQTRLGLHGKPMIAYKFRTMLYDDSASREWVVEGTKNRVTAVGAFLRKTSLDEFPQCINVLRGQLSLVGPRNDIAGLAERLSEVIPYYQVRYAVVPGITGWAQINQHYAPGNLSPQSIEETKVRLAYDFYYIKNRSLALDLVIALKTFKRMLFRVS